MSLYHEAASILETTGKGGSSIKFQVYSKKGWKSDPKTLFALTTEAAKWSEVLTDVVERSRILKAEKQFSPPLAVVLVHDLLLSKNGVALPAKHGLRISINRHKARLAAELSKARLRRGFATVEELRANIDSEDQTKWTVARHPRWIRINTLLTTLDEQLKSTFTNFTHATSLDNVLRASKTEKLLYVDEHVSNLIAIPAHIDFSADRAYLDGKIIFQDKASCFPALLLNTEADDGDILDACAAPGNKTTHLAAILHHNGTASRGTYLRKIIACEKDPIRSVTLQKLVKVADAEKMVSVQTKQDFLKLDPHAKEMGNVTALLLDPSCSGSGIVGRDEDSTTVHLPSRQVEDAPLGKKRKRNGTDGRLEQTMSTFATALEETPLTVSNDKTKLEARLLALSSFQLRLLEHAMAFPAARRITYSTCSVYSEENECVLIKALQTDIAVRRGWRILKREQQSEGLRSWPKRGSVEACCSVFNDNEQLRLHQSLEDVADACLKCEKGTNDGTMGFFVVGFVRDADQAARTLLAGSSSGKENKYDNFSPSDHDTVAVEEEWRGFSDGDT